jgi:hypothetical protein
VALAANEADGLAEYSETWPSAGMMQNGKTYRRQPWALPIAENASGLLPTVRKSGQSIAFKCFLRRYYQVNLEEFLGRMGFSGFITQEFVMWMMGFPQKWADISRLETQSSRKSPK